MKIFVLSCRRAELRLCLLEKVAEIIELKVSSMNALKKTIRCLTLALQMQQGCLIHITGGTNLTLQDAEEIATHLTSNLDASCRM